MQPETKHLKTAVCVIGVALAMLAGSTQAQQFPNPRTPPRFPVPRRATR